MSTTKGNTLPNGLSSGSTSPWYFISTSKRECGLSALFHLIHLFLGPIPSSRQDLFSMDKKVYPWGVPPRVSFRSCHPHVMPLHQSAHWVDSPKHEALLVWFIPLCSVYLFKMVKSRQALVLYSVPITVLMDMISTLWNLPMGKACLTALFHRTRSEDLTRLAKQFPWDHQIVRTLDHEVHRRKMAGKSNHFLGHWDWGPSLTRFSCPFFSFLDHPRMPSRLPHLSVGGPSQPWIRVQPLRAKDGWVHHGRFNFRERDRFLNRRCRRAICSCRRSNESGLGRLAPENDLSDQFLSQGQS